MAKERLTYGRPAQRRSVCSSALVPSRRWSLPTLGIGRMHRPDRNSEITYRMRSLKTFVVNPRGSVCF